jgi:serine/threonine protein kinase
LEVKTVNMLSGNTISILFDTKPEYLINQSSTTLSTASKFGECLFREKIFTTCGYDFCQPILKKQYRVRFYLLRCGLCHIQKFYLLRRGVAMSDRVGQQFGNYRLIRLLGQGGFADVYLGQHIYLGTQAAVKVLNTRLTDDSLEKFLAEARTIVRLEHPHIVRVLECSVENQVPFLVMSYAPGGSLRQRYPSGTRLELEEVLLYVKQVASALQCAHDKKLIHRDVKPENMLLGQNKEVLLSDFGLVLAFQSTRSQTKKEMAGTVPYMAPEQLEGKPCAASDQYALGIVAYEWLSGEWPFQGSFIEIATQHVLTPPQPLRNRILGISPAVEEVIFTALAKEPEQRFPSVEMFGTALQQAYHKKTTSHRPVQLSASDPPLNKFAPPGLHGLWWSTILLRSLVPVVLIILLSFLLAPIFSKFIGLGGRSPLPVSPSLALSVPTVTQTKTPNSTAVSPSPASPSGHAVLPTPAPGLTPTQPPGPTVGPNEDHSVRMINNDDAGITYAGSCSYKKGPATLYNGDAEICTQQNDTFTYTFIGTSISLVTGYSQKRGGTISCYIDGNLTQSFDLRPGGGNGANFKYGVMLPIASKLAYGQHTASCVMTAASGQYMVIDALVINK